MSCQNLKMADAVTARREARRRKILENSQNRLQIISGKSSDECPRESPINAVIPELDYELPAGVSISSHSSTSHQNGLLFSPPSVLFELLSASTASHDIDASGDGEVIGESAPLWPPTSVPPTSEPEDVVTLSSLEKLTTYKYDIVLLSLLLQICYSLSLIRFDSGYIFLPVIVYIVTKLIWFPTQNSPNITNMLLASVVLNGMPPERIQKILYLSECSWVISRDIFVFLFISICIQALWLTLKDNFVT